MLELEYPHLVDVNFESAPSFMRRYIDYKRTKSLVDYDDLLTKLRDLLADHAEVRQRLSDTYRFIMVDEYQDTNHLQAEIVRLLAATHDNVAVVGDDAQSIYSFRGANFRNIMDFPKHFPGARIIKLEENYRSTQPILNLTNEIIQRAKEGYDKRLFTQQKRRAPVPSWSRPAASRCSRNSSVRKFSNCARKACRCGTSPCCFARASIPSIWKSN